MQKDALIGIGNAEKPGHLCRIHLLDFAQHQDRPLGWGELLDRIRDVGQDLSA
jgi:hypothetical protein